MRSLVLGIRSLCFDLDFRGKEFRVLVRVTSWIVPFVQKNKDDLRSHTNQQEPTRTRLQLDVTFEAKSLGTSSWRAVFTR